MLRLRAVVFHCEAASSAAAFWAALLGRRVVHDPLGALVVGEGTQLGLRFREADAGVGPSSSTHLHVTSTSLEDQADRVAAALALGARHLDVGQQPEEGHVVLADVAGTALCVIEPGNAFLAGCGLLGEVACDGGRDVGVFWSAALGWPLVWDRDDETAVQAPTGGTKVAWGGASPEHVPAMTGPLFDVVTTGASVAAEVERLVALGATAVHRAEDSALLLDPGGARFRLGRD